MAIASSGRLNFSWLGFSIWQLVCCTCNVESEIAQCEAQTTWEQFCVRQWRLRVTKLAVAGTDRLFSSLGFGSVEFVARHPEVLRVTSHRSRIAWSRNRMYNSDTTSCNEKQANDQILIRARIKKTYCKTFTNTLCSSVQQNKST